jgi:hypothetical protein
MNESRKTHGLMITTRDFFLFVLEKRIKSAEKYRVQLESDINVSTYVYNIKLETTGSLCVSSHCDV